MQPITANFLKFIGSVAAYRMVGETRRWSGLVEEVDLQTDTVLIRHRDGRCSLLKASAVVFMSAVRPKKEAKV